MFLRKAVYVVLTGGLFCLFFSTGVFAASDLVAKVGGVPVTRWELSRETERMLPRGGGVHSHVSGAKLAEIRAKALENLIDQAYKVRYAQAKGISVGTAAFAKRFKPIFAGLKPEEIKKALNGEDEEAFRASVYRIMLAKKAEKFAVDDNSKLTDAEVKEYYEKHRSAYLRPKQYRLSDILIKVNPSADGKTREELKTKAEDLAKKAQGGEDFYNLAYYNSDDERSKWVGGDLGFVHESRLPESVRKVLGKMKVGEITAPLENMYGYHILKVVEIEEQKQLSLVEVQDKIREKLRKEKRAAVYAAWMSSLKSRYQVERFGPQQAKSDR